MMDRHASSRRAQLLLSAGALTGIVLALWSALGVGATLDSYSDAIAIVDGVPVSRTQYEISIASLAETKRTPLTEADRRVVLERIIDQELLFQRAVSLGLPQLDPATRKALIDAMLQFAVADATRGEPSEAELRAYYDSNPDLMTREPLIALQAVSFSRGDDTRISAMAQAIAAGHSLESAAQEIGVTLLPLPGSPIPATRIAEYAGPAVRETALTLDAGTTAGPIEAGERVIFVTVMSRQPGDRIPFESVRETVKSEWINRASERAFSEYIEEMRRSARITYAPDVPAWGKK